jgi:hypothetical protein
MNNAGKPGYTDIVKGWGRYGWGELRTAYVFNKKDGKGQYIRFNVVYDVVKDGDKWFHVDETRR